MHGRLSKSLLVFAGIVLASALGDAAVAQGRAEVRLSLAECLRMALDNNLDLVAARKDPEISEQNVVVQQAAFDLGIFSDPMHRESEQEISNLFSLNAFKSDEANLGLSQDTSIGANYTVNLDLSRDESTGPQVITDVSYDASLALSATIPLLNGQGKLVNTEQLVLAQGNLDISREELRRQAELTLEQVEGAYWDLVADIRALEVARQALTRAEDLLELNRKKVEVGTLAPIEITQAEAGVASQEEIVIVSETSVENSEDELRRLLAVPAHHSMWESRIAPTSQPDFRPISVSLEQSIATAMDSRPELINARSSLRNDELSERVAKRNLRPQLDLSASYTPQGNNFNTVFVPNDGPDMIPGTIDDGVDAVQETTGTFDEALAEIPDLENYSWSLGLTFRYPIGNRAAKANYSIASLSRQKATINVQNQEQTIRVEVRRAVRSVSSGIKRVDAARKNVELQREKLDAEEKKFENGMSTSFEVLTFQNDLADAELSLIRAALDYIKALAGLERSKGTLLEARGLQL